MMRLSRWKVSLFGGVAALAVAGLLLRWRVQDAQSLRKNSFRIEKQDDWQPFGGAWEVVDGVMRNNSDERGAKRPSCDIGAFAVTKACVVR